MVYGSNADNNLTVGAKELFCKVQLLHLFIQRQVDYVFLSFLGDGKGYFVFRIEIGNVRYLKRPETVGSINKVKRVR